DRLEFVYKPTKPPTKPYEILQTLSGRDLIGRRYEPLFSFFASTANAFSILESDHVTLDAGTGIVHMAPAYGEDDFRVCRAHHIDIVDPLDDEARFSDQVPDYQGQFVKDADKSIIKDLKNGGKVLRHDTLVHSYPHCDRTQDPLIYRAIPTWYVAVEKLKERLRS